MTRSGSVAKRDPEDVAPMFTPAGPCRLISALPELSDAVEGVKVVKAE
jgi:hypothetical protein